MDCCHICLHFGNYWDSLDLFTARYYWCRINESIKNQTFISPRQCSTSLVLLDCIFVTFGELLFQLFVEFILVAFHRIPPLRALFSLFFKLFTFSNGISNLVSCFMTEFGGFWVVCQIVSVPELAHPFKRGLLSKFQGNVLRRLK
jgi:hypothetical protein